MKSESGFTLIELLTVIGIISVCALLGLTSFYEYRGDAAYAVAERLVGDANTAVEVAISAPDTTLPSVSNYSQTTQGPLTDAAAKTVFPGLMVPRRTRITMSYNPTCSDATCESARVQAKHCSGRDYLSSVRYGDGVMVRLEHIAGIGCN